VQTEIEKQYYKPHFGPEETDEMVEKEKERVQGQKISTKEDLINQIALKNSIKLQNFQVEREGELDNIQTAQTMYVCEEKARADKIVKEK